MILEGFVLGLSNGTTCAAYCAPTLLPYLAGESRGIARSAVLTGEFLIGRLFGYMAFAVLAWGVHRMILPGGTRQEILIGAVDIVFSLLLIFYGFFRTEARCAASPSNVLTRRITALWPAALPVAAGFATGLSFCPPFVLAFTNAAGQADLLSSLAFFFAFFAGTSVLFAAAPFIGAFRGFQALKIVGKMAAGLVGLYYLYSGVIRLIGGNL